MIKAITEICEGVIVEFDKENFKIFSTLKPPNLTNCSWGVKGGSNRMQCKHCDQSACI